MLNRVLLKYSKFGGSIPRMASSNVLLGYKSTFTYNNAVFNHNYRFFSKKAQKEETKKPKEEAKTNEEEEQQEFHHDETLDEDNAANFSTTRKIFFALGKAIKYAFWTYCVLFAYHFYLVRNNQKPEEAVG